MQKRIFRSIFLTALMAVLIIGLFTGHSFYQIFESQTANEVATEADMLARALERIPDDVDFLKTLPDKSRITLIDRDGTVLYDNRVPAEKMDNHGSRPEVRSAMQNGSGLQQRRSDTLTEKTLYYALRLKNSQILRIAMTYSNILGLLHHVLIPLFVVLILTSLLALLLSKSLARHITAPLGQIDLASPLKQDVYDELSPLLLRLQEQNDTLRLQLSELSRQRQELTAITENMREGLLMLDRDGIVLSINKSAAQIFASSQKEATGHNIIELNRSAGLMHVVQEAQNGRGGEDSIELNGRIYRLLSTPVNGENIPGIVVLVLDVTARERAERERREFSANVSHELRTPLTSIAGYSEIMSNGLAKPEDTSHFAALIHKEAERLVAMVNDIMELSRLDEKARLPQFEDVDLYSLCEKVLPRLKGAAENKKVTLSLQGEHVSIRGIPHLLDELIFNLTENAVKYNVPDGSVEIGIFADDHSTSLSVKDTGTGIPPEQQERIFERFYRIDQSHSKETGGTGLGLAIVKHVAAIHRAKIDLQSAPGKGSCFTVIFPKN
ncbi:MAG: ATP-binding protein [Pyramidobacter sp.]|jgi:two-component system phosphate regulon sensor histidine kinase PhoR